MSNDRVKPIDVAIAFLKHALKDGSKTVAEINRLASRAGIKKHILIMAKAETCRSYLDGSWYVSLIKEDVSI